MLNSTERILWKVKMVVDASDLVQNNEMRVKTFAFVFVTDN